MYPTKNIAVFYYSQTGQLKELVEKCLDSLPAHIEIDWIKIVPKNDFPFPWSGIQFFNTMPECVMEEGIEVVLEQFTHNKKYDLIVLAFQPWFLHPSLPISGFMQSEQASNIFKENKVITIIGARNMWLNALEKIKRYLYQWKSYHVGNIAFVDSSPNLVSTLTIIRWLFKGRKGASRFLPKAGIQDAELLRAPEYGKIIGNALMEDNWQTLQSQLVDAGAVSLNPGLILLERTGIKQFNQWAKRIKKRGDSGSLERIPMVRVFKNFLIFGIFVMSPIKAIISRIMIFAKRKSLASDLIYFKSVTYNENKF
ncbi:MAG: hypothetical protein M9911_00975 [Saprospiraceae bacterium]|nr:hypothetical protein [Saprospiraceae bacterium]